MKLKKFFKFSWSKLIIALFVFLLLGILFGFPHRLPVVCESEACFSDPPDISCSCPLGNFIFLGFVVGWLDNKSELFFDKVIFYILQIIMSYLIACILNCVYLKIKKK
jgi:hypothetical protein